MKKSTGTREDNSRSDKPQNLPADSETPDTPSDEQSLTFVGIGASAGGLEALTGLLPNLPATGNLAVAIIQHRGKDDSSLMPALLQKTTRLKVVEIQDGMKIQPNHVYLNPPHRAVSIQNQTFFLSDYQDAAGPSLPIDAFFKSLAGQFMKRGVCIILSGTGSDGSHGLMAVREAGGLTIVQDEKQAKYKGMPQSAIDTKHVDIVLRVEEMGEQIAKYISHPFQKDIMTEEQAESSEHWLSKICEIIRKRTGHDFSGYKTSTLKRRIQKRMAMHQITDTTDYIRFLQENEKEVEALFDDALITVTNFFRNPQAWQSLRENVIKKLVETKPAGSPIRVWSAGCATGEEAYSAAILLLEQMRLQDKLYEIQVFATDVNGKSIQFARKGTYPRHIKADMPDEKWLKHYFDEVEHGYKVKNFVREMVVFAEQDMITDPPFSKVDLLCCRNTLIYMRSVVQKRVLSSFQYSLNPGGYLFLGTSEAVGDYAERFISVDSKNKIFRMNPAIEAHIEEKRDRTPIGKWADSTVSKTKQGPPAAEYPSRNVYRVIEKLILQHYSHPCVLVDNNYDIAYLCGDTDRYLRHPSGRASLNFFQMVRPELHHILSRVLHQAMKEQKTFTKKDFHIKYNDILERVDLLVRPVRMPDQQLFILLVFQPAATQAGIALEEVAKGPKDAPWQEHLQRELQETRQYLNTTIQELETRNEELQTFNEELQSANEELKTTNEELETSREELQSTNEELRSVNEERIRQNEELLSAKDDLQNLLSSTKVATIFLDTDLCIKRYTPEAAVQFNFRASDIGRPLGDITHNLKYESMIDDANHVLDDLASVQKEIRAKDGGTFIVRMMPYRTTQNMIEGLVITLIDITSEKYAREYAESIVETVSQPLIVLNDQKRVISANRAFHLMFKTTPDEVRNKNFYDLGNRQWDIAELKELIERVLPYHQKFEGFFVERTFPKVGFRKMVINARQVVNKAIKTQRILLAINDVTEGKREE